MKQPAELSDEDAKLSQINPPIQDTFPAKYAIRRFNTQLAEMYGVNAALLYHHIKLRTDMVPSHFVRLTLDDFTDVHPYLGQREVRNALRVLTHPSRRYPAIVNRNGSAAVNDIYLSPPATTIIPRVASRLMLPKSDLHCCFTG